MGRGVCINELDKMDMILFLLTDAFPCPFFLFLFFFLLPSACLESASSAFLPCIVITLASLANSTKLTIKAASTSRLLSLTYSLTHTMVLITEDRPTAQRPRARSETLLPSSTTPFFASSPTHLIPKSSTFPLTPSSTTTVTTRNTTPRSISIRLLRLVKPGLWRWLILTLTITLSIYSLRQLHLHLHGGGVNDLLFQDQDQHTYFLHEQTLLRPHDSQNREPGAASEGGGKKYHSRKHSPEQWLRENSFSIVDDDDDDDNSSAESAGAGRLFGNSAPRPRAAIISLVRNEELDGILQSMRQLELHWNRRFGYPWIFFNERPFSDEFKVSDRSIDRSID
jgi:hypothetical protein